MHSSFWQPRVLAPSLLCAALVIAGCGKSTGAGGSTDSCTSDADCGEGLICDVPTALCVSDPGPAPAIQGGALPDAFKGASYAQTLSAEGGQAPLSFAMVNVAPGLDWLHLDAATGALSGKPPVEAPSAGFDVTVTDALGRTASATFSVAVLSCHDGDKVDCSADVSGACFFGQQSCSNGEFGTCNASVPSTDVGTCGQGCGTCTPSLADSCDAGTCACGAGGACAGGSELCCAGSCRNTQSDPQACGACGAACDTTRANVVVGCDAGTCEYPCAPGFARCPEGSTAASCETDLMNDVQNCGSCGKTCPTNLPHVLSMSCKQGGCAIEQCDANFADCDGNVSNGCEVDLLNDPAHCGGCGTTCSAGANVSGVACVAGACEIATCATGFADCDHQFSNGCEISTTNDASNCGACGVACTGQSNATGYACQASACVITTCAQDYADCDGAYATGCEVNLNSTSSCGACGNVCGGKSNATGYSCTNQSCKVSSCATGFSDCDGQYADGCEVNITTLSNCGACGVVCGGKPGVSGYACTSGACAITACYGTTGDCDKNYANGCETPLNTTANCGACGNTCGGKANATGYACSASGACAITACAAGFADCDGNYANGCETSLNSLGNCGACGNVCSSKPNATGIACVNNACAVTTCAAGFANCDGQYANGCEANLNSTATCGSCSNSCSGKANATGYACSAGSCSVTSCSAGFANCDGQYANGCEVNTTNSTNNCGACGNVCGGRQFASGYFCSASTCGFTTCQSGHSDCDGTYSNGCEYPSGICP